ncbi:MAG TPA: hypothetical protein VKA88_01030 [Solirubrobacterales bacterium]|nr:hypothetical protein [Solirubrobacterales bacterium]
MSIARTLAALEARIDEAVTLARGSADVWEAAEAGMQRIGEITVLASEQAIEAAGAARDASSRAAIAESHAERGAASAAAAAMRCEALSRQAPPRPPRRARERPAKQPLRPRPVLRQAPLGARRSAGGDDPLQRFSRRADTLVARLHAIERHRAGGSDPAE